MLMYNLLEYSTNYKKQQATYRIITSTTLSLNSESFKYKANIVGKTPENNYSLTNTKIAIPLKHLSNF